MGWERNHGPNPAPGSSAITRQAHILARQHLVTMLSSNTPEIPPGNLAALAEDHYFNANPPPKDLDKHVALAREFIDYHSAAGRRLVLVTSGGTTVPLGMF